MTKKTVTLTEDTFIGGSLLPAGSVTTIDLDDIGGKLGKDTPNLIEVGKHHAAAPVPYEVASIGPTGPNPTKPQSLPPGSIQVGEAYLAPGAPGEPAVQPVAEGSTDDGKPKRRGS